MKKIFTLAVILISAAAVQAQSKSDVSATKQVETKVSQKAISTESAAKLENKLKKNTSKRINAQGFMTQAELNARKEEIKNNPKKSTKPNQD